MKILENEENNQDPSENPLYRSKISVVFTPSTDINKVLEALNNIDNYGLYKINMRNQQAVEDNYGPPIPARKARIENDFKSMYPEDFLEKYNLGKFKTLSSNNGKFYPKTTRAEMEKFIEDKLKKPDILSWEVNGNEIIFPENKNPSKKVIEKVLQIVLKSANIPFNPNKDLSEKELNERMMMNKVELMERVKKRLQKIL